MKVLVLGDYIDDIYEFYTATRLCPEGPVPVLVHAKDTKLSAGGAGLVHAQLRALGADTIFLTGSVSNKTRIFADDRLMVRIDDDGFDQTEPEEYKKRIEAAFNRKPDGIVVSDYDKGAFDYPTGQWLAKRASELKIPVFVDAKKNWYYHTRCFALFPNKSEQDVDHQFVTDHVIQKLGSEGCNVDGVHIPTNSHPVRDVTGAGDCFIAAFVYNFLLAKQVLPKLEEKSALEHAARFANKVAGISVEFVGTHVVSKEEIENRIDNILET